MKAEDLLVIDSFAWFEYFLGSEPGRKVVNYVERGRTITPTIVIAELSEKYRTLSIDFKERLRFIKFRSKIVLLDEETAEYAGQLAVERKKKIRRWGMADSIVLATARLNKCRIITGDEHFRDLTDETIMIK